MRLDSDVDAQLPPPSWRAPRCRSAVGRALAELSHGDAILAPPVQSIIARGYAVALFYPGEIAPDDARLFRQAPISRLINADTGAIAVWSSLYLSIVEALHAEPRIDATRIAIWGHSRFGKAALLAGALDNRVAAIIANQSGAFGATLSQATRGETSAEILRRFPHWFSQTAATRTQALEPLDQHLLLALLAPRPVLLGNAELDRWSDPGAAFVAARAASEVYVLFGRPGLTQPRMRDTALNSNIAFYLRPGGHGVRSTDWFIALDFLDRHFPGRPSHFASSGETNAEATGGQ
ncbi:MAG: hypothetical protein HC869_11540 [Rhodospirillales bacterium]|nr:hypothetical protein [Rhodospirillales bacterium]